MKLTLLDLTEAKIQAAAMSPAPALTDVAGWAELFTGLKTASGQLVSREKALRCSAVLACVRILMEDVASLPLILKEKSKQGATEAVNHPLYRLLKAAPNPWQTSLEVREHIMLDYLLHGRFFNYVPRDSSGKPTGIYPIDAGTMAYAGKHRNGDLVWSCADRNFPTRQSFTHQELWRGNLFNFNFVEGRSLIMLAREAIGLAVAAEEQGARLFSNGIQTDIVFKAKETLDQESKEQLRSALQDAYSGSKNAWRALLLENELDVAKIGLTAQESQYIESRHYQLSDIARIMRVPGVLLGLNDKTNTYASAEQFFQAYVKHTIGPWCHRIEQTADRDLILPNETGLFVKHNLNALLRGDQKTRFEGYKTGIEGGFMTLAQARAEEEWDELPGLDVTWRPANFVAVKDGKTIPDTAPNDAKYPATPSPAPVPGPKQGPDKAGKVANNVASSILRSENREFARMSRKAEPSEGQAANFAAWHVDKVIELTGASGPAARLYSDWRFANPDAEDEARERLINLCLDGEL
jgi:HK97 family phage portal protein